MVITAPAYSVLSGSIYIVAEKVISFHGKEANGRYGTEVLLMDNQRVQIDWRPYEFSEQLQQALANSTASEGKHEAH